MNYAMSGSEVKDSIPSQMEQTLNQLRYAMNDNENKMLLLGDRLAPVLGDSPPPLKVTNVPCEQPRAESSSYLIRELENIIAHFDRSNSHINEIMSRLVV